MFFNNNNPDSQYMDRPDRISRDGKLAGYDDRKTGETSWYNKNCELDCKTKTPRED